MPLHLIYDRNLDVFDITTRPRGATPPSSLTDVSVTDPPYASFDRDAARPPLLRIVNASLHLPPAFVVPDVKQAPLGVRGNRASDTIELYFGDVLTHSQGTHQAKYVSVDEVMLNDRMFLQFVWAPARCLGALVLHDAVARWREALRK